MKPPVNIEALLEMWSTDSKLNETEAARELAKIPNLHAKYLTIVSYHNLVIKKLTYDYNTMKKIKWEYYSGDLNNPEDLKKYNWEPWQKRVLRQDMSIYLDADDDLNTILKKKVIHQEIVDVCNSILKELQNRTYQLSNIVKWTTFYAGS